MNTDLFGVDSNSHYLRQEHPIRLLRKFGAIALLLSLAWSNELAAVEASITAQTAGRVVTLVGGADAIDDSGSSRQLLRNSQVLAGDIINSRAASHIQLRMIDSAIIALGCESSLKVDSYRHEKNHLDIVEVQLLKGSLRTITGWIGSQNRDAYKFKVADTKVEVRGTDFEVHLQANGKVYFANYNGGITISNTFGSLDLGIGGDFDFAVIEPKQAPSGLRNRPQPLLRNSLPILTPLSQQTSCN